MTATYSCATIRQAEQAWAERQGRPTFDLMQEAARAVADRAGRMFRRDQPICFLCGSGNNGGDGVLAASYLHQAGWPVQLWLSREPRADTDAASALAIAQAAGVPRVDHLAQLAGDQYVDALLGTGFSGEPGGRVGEAIQWLQTQRSRSTRVLSLDCPSGLACDSGAAGRVVTADVTLSFVGLKTGQLTGQGPGVCGHIYLDDLGAAPPLELADTCLVDTSALTWPERAASAHKGCFGQVLVVGGAPGMPGAVALAAESALVSGAGRVCALTAPENRSTVVTRSPEVMVPGALTDTARSNEVLLLGPGLGRDATAATCFAQSLAWADRQNSPLVVDADGLWHLAARPETPRTLAVMTPHPGEAAHLLGISVAEAEADRPETARRLQHQWGGVVVLKGAGTLVATPEQLFLVAGGHGAMATSGLGDVLGGCIAALMAQTMSADQAACGAASALVTAAIMAAQERPVARATGVLTHLPTALFRAGLKSQRSPGVSRHDADAEA